MLANQGLKALKLSSFVLCQFVFIFVLYKYISLVWCFIFSLYSRFFFLQAFSKTFVIQGFLILLGFSLNVECKITGTSPKMDYKNNSCCLHQHPASYNLSSRIYCKSFYCFWCLHSNQPVSFLNSWFLLPSLKHCRQQVITYICHYNHFLHFC